jgi:hypothetical protein
MNLFTFWENPENFSVIFCRSWRRVELTFQHEKVVFFACSDRNEVPRECLVTVEGGLSPGWV